MDVIFAVGGVANMIYVLYALYNATNPGDELEIKNVGIALLIIAVCVLGMYACFEMDGVPCFLIKRN